MAKEQSGSKKQNRTGKVRIGVFIPAALDQNMRLYCLKENIVMQEAVTSALRRMIKAEGMDPDKVPIVQYKY